MLRMLREGEEELGEACEGWSTGGNGAHRYGARDSTREEAQGMRKDVQSHRLQASSHTFVLHLTTVPYVTSIGRGPRHMARTL